jgi:hypothetical protein
MIDERAYIARLESADPQELASMLATPTAEQEKTLRVYLGDERYQRMHDLALKRNSTRRAAAVEPRGNVIVIPGIMGSELTARAPRTTSGCRCTGSSRAGSIGCA